MCGVPDAEGLNGSLTTSQVACSYLMSFWMMSALRIQLTSVSIQTLGGFWYCQPQLS